LAELFKSRLDIGLLSVSSYPSVDETFGNFQKEVSGRARHLLGMGCKPIAGDHLYRLGIADLPKYHKRNLLCLNIADKGYGFAVTNPSTISVETAKLIEEKNFVEVEWQQLLSETAGNAGFLKWRLEKAFYDRTISQKSLNALVPWEALPISLAHGPEFASRLSGCIRFMPKLHKKDPQLRQVENDGSNPFKSVARWLAKILNNLVAAHCHQTGASHRDVLNALWNFQIVPENGKKLCLISSGIVDFSRQISISRDCPKVSQFVHSHLPKKEADLICCLCCLLKIILSHKFFKICIGGRDLLCKKCSSLSIGELVATAFANIVRHVDSCSFVGGHGMLFHFGYVDDTLSVLHATDAEKDSWLEAMNRSIAPMEWKHGVSEVEISLLDLALHVEKMAMCCRSVVPCSGNPVLSHIIST